MLLKADSWLKFFLFLCLSTTTNYADIHLTTALPGGAGSKAQSCRQESDLLHILHLQDVLQEPAESHEPLDAPTW